MRQNGRGASVRQAQLLSAVRAHYAELGRPPSFKEIAARVGTGIPAAYELTKKCCEMGLLAVVKRKGERTQVRLLDPLDEISTAILEQTIFARRMTAEIVQFGEAFTALLDQLPENDPKDADLRLAA